MFDSTGPITNLTESMSDFTESMPDFTEYMSDLTKSISDSTRPKTVSMESIFDLTKSTFVSTE